MGVKIPFRRELAFEYGQVAEVSGLIRRVVARNPSPFTLYGTGTYIVGHGEVAVIDPGPADPAHIQAIVDAPQGETITHILVTHTHRDHSPGTRLLKEKCAAKSYAYGPHGSGRRDDQVQIEEGADLDFTPDVEVRHGDVIRGRDWTVECVYTPGHTSNHMCFALREERVLFTGDHVMAWSTSVISPPDGDMQAYMESLALLLNRDDSVYWPTHGPAVEDPKAYVEAFIAHRREREAQILECIDRGVLRVREMVPYMYKELPEFMYPAAARSVFAAVRYMVQRGELRSGDGHELNIDASYYRA
jgi:glyoxylase-like metal-dependent hydrolase (beta-lactamase superfamily II)